MTIAGVCNMINVVATQQGYYGHFRNTGDNFLIKDASVFSRTWMSPKSKEDVAKLKKSITALETNKAEEAEKEPVDDDFGLADNEKKEEPIDELDNMDKEQLIEFGKANCEGLSLSRNMNDDTLKERIRSYNP